MASVSSLPVSTISDAAMVEYLERHLLDLQNELKHLKRCMHSMESQFNSSQHQQPSSLMQIEALAVSHQQKLVQLAHVLNSEATQHLHKLPSAPIIIHEEENVDVEPMVIEKHDNEDDGKTASVDGSNAKDEDAKDEDADEIIPQNEISFQECYDALASLDDVTFEPQADVNNDEVKELESSIIENELRNRRRGEVNVSEDATSPPEDKHEEQEQPVNEAKNGPELIEKANVRKPKTLASRNLLIFVFILLLAIVSYLLSNSSRISANRDEI